MNDVGFSSPLVVNPLVKLGNVPLDKKLPSSAPLDPSRELRTPASPVVAVFEPGAVILESTDDAAANGALDWATAAAWPATPSASVVDCGAVNGVNCVAALEAPA